ncbi:hypothetical protein [Serratia marcescens]|uniref:hypothetical protein n=1 Tax=Serratia marcescens TaxID=615 RepID=UPI0010224B9B|nr:hypothetical protein [Serratia marcescens]
MALTESQSAKLSATIAENAAAEAKSYADLAAKAGDFSKDAESAAEAAAASESQAKESAQSATDAALSAQDSANSADIASSNAALSANVYPSVSAAQDAITAGTIPLNALFNIVSASDLRYVDQYKNISGVATTTGKSYPSSAYVNQIASFNAVLGVGFTSEWIDRSPSSDSVTLTADLSGRKTLYLDNTKQHLVAYGKTLADQEQVNGIGSETWKYSGADNSKIVELVDLSGRIIKYLDISTQKYYVFGKEIGSQSSGYIAPEFLPEFIDVRTYGQSLSIYLLGSPGITTSVSNSYMFNTFVLTYNTSPTSLTTLPSTTSNQYQQSLIYDWQQKEPVSFNSFLAACSGVSGYSMAKLEPGTDPYAQMIATIQKAKDLANNQGKQYGMIGFCFMQGEADAYDGTGYEYYRLKQAEMQSVTNSYHKSISKLPYDVPMFIYQMASHGRYAGLLYPSSDIPLAQLDEAVDNPLVQLATPMYIFPYADGVHLTNQGYRWRDLFFAKAQRYWYANKAPWRPLHPINVSRVGNNTAVVDFYVPHPPLQFRSDIVANLPDNMRGFELWNRNSSGVYTRLTVTSVTIIGDKKVKVVTSGTFSGTTYLCYAFTPQNQGSSDGAGRYPSWNAGPLGSNGVCGQLCDSDTETTDLLNASGQPYDLKNYCVIFKKEVL